MNLIRKYIYLTLLVFALTCAGSYNAHSEDTRRDKNIISDDHLDLVVKDPLERCAAITSRASRLSCYDTIAIDKGFVTRSAVERDEKELSTYGFWEVTARKNSIGEDLTFLRLEPNAASMSKSGVKKKPMLFIRCKKGSSDVYIDWQSPLIQAWKKDQEFAFIYIMDDGEPHTVNWELSLDKQALFSPQPVEFIKELKEQDRLIARITPYADVMHTFIYELDGIEKVLDILVDRCYN